MRRGYLMRIVRLLWLRPLLSFVPVSASADAVVAGDLVKFSDGPGNTGGGEFKLTVNGNPANWFITFCLQKTEYMNFSSNFVVGSITDHTLTDPTGPFPTGTGGNAAGEDKISAETAWLYTQFRNGTLTGYNYSGGSAESATADVLQHAIWGLESEEALDTHNAFVTLAMQQHLNPLDIGNVRVLNLFTTAGGEAQDQLVLVPEPSTLALMGVGAAVTTFRRRRFTRA
jgi:hypothetical protein